MQQSLSDMRRDYTRDGLCESQAPLDPFKLFRQWLSQAVETEQPPVEANAMTLATVDADGRPHCRVLLLKGLDEQGFTFFGNYESAKGEQLAARPFAAMTFFWPGLERQVRIEGRVERLSSEESAAYYQQRPRGSRLGAWAAPQSRVVAARSALQPRVAVTASCTACEVCSLTCPARALSWRSRDGVAELILDADACTACGECARLCPEPAITVTADAAPPGPVIIARVAPGHCDRCRAILAPGEGPRCTRCEAHASFAADIFGV